MYLKAYYMRSDTNLLKGEIRIWFEKKAKQIVFEG